MPTLSTYTSNQSHQEARPWSIFALQPCDGQILPVGITNDDLSFQYQQCSGTTSQFTPPHKPDRAIMKAKNQLSSELPQHARHNRQKPKGRNPPRDTVEKSLRVGRDSWNSAGHSGVRPTTAATSGNSTARRGGRREGYSLPEVNRISAKRVRARGACFRCYVMKAKVRNGGATNTSGTAANSSNKVLSWRGSLQKLRKGHSKRRIPDLDDSLYLQKAQRTV